MSKIRETLKKIRQIDYPSYLFIIFGMYIALTKSQADVIGISNDLSEWIHEFEKKGKK